MGRSNTVRSLEKEYAKILGKIESRSAVNCAGSFEEALTAIQIVIRLWEPEWTPDHVKPTRPKRRYAPHGEQSKLLFEFLKDQNIEFSTNDAASYLEQALQKQGFQSPPEQNRKTYCYQFFIRLEKEGFVEKLSSRPARWRKHSD